MDGPRELTSATFHVVGLEAFIHESNAKSDVHTHALFLDKTSKSILHKNVCRVAANIVRAVANLLNNLHVPFPLRLT